MNLTTSEQTARPLAVLGAIMFVFGAAYILYHAFFSSIINLNQSSDFPTYFASGTTLRHGQNPYDLTALRHQAKNIPGHESVAQYVYPPVMAEVMAPLSLLSYRLARIIWSIVWLALLVFTGRELYLLLTAENRVWFWPLAGIALMSAPLTSVIIRGQLELFVLYLILRSARAARDGQHILGGCLIGLISAIKLYPLFFLLPTIVRRQWRTVFAATMTAVIVMMMAFAPWPRAWWSPYFSSTIGGLLTGQASQAVNVTGTPTFSGTKYWPNNYALSGLFAHTLTRQAVTRGLANVPTVATILTYLSTAVVLALTVRALFRFGQSRPLLALALTLTTYVLIAPLAWEYYLVLVLPALILAAITISSQARFPLIVLAVSFAILQLNIYPWTPFLRHGFGTILMSVKTFALIALYAVLLWLIAARSPEPQTV